jgi:hypothetical protein
MPDFAAPAYVQARVRPFSVHLGVDLPYLEIKWTVMDLQISAT